MTLYRTDDLRIKWTKVVLPPVFLEEELPVTEKAAATVHDARTAICDILAGRDPRLLVVVGPCSIHDTKAAREYAQRLKSVTLGVCPRAAAGDAGVLREAAHDRRMERAHQRSPSRPVLQDQRWLAAGAALLLDLAEMGVPAGTEFLDMMTPQYLVSLVSWGAIGARTTESQVHRQLVSGPLLSGGIQERDLRRRADRHRGRAVGGASAYISRPYQERAVRHLRHHGQSRLPCDPARRKKIGEL